MQFQTHDLASAPAGAKEALAGIQLNYGFLPNLAGVFAESPATLNGLLGAMAAFDAKDMTLSLIERQVVLLAASVRNRCEYCAAAHGMLANKHGLDRSEVDKLQQGKPLRDTRLEILRQFTETVVAQRGWIGDGDREKFLGAGFTKAQVLEVIFGVALKTLTNYANHIAKPAVNEQFTAYAPSWTRAD